MTQHGLSGGTPKLLNAYGDTLMPSGGNGHGSNISNQRRDDLDDMALRSARNSVVHLSDTTVYDIGCGQGAMTMEFARLGCTVVACDLEPMPALAKFSQQSAEASPLHIVQKDARHVDWTGYPKPNILYSQRFIHYLRYDEARELVSTLTSREGVLVFLSMSGLHSELGKGYSGAGQSLKNRFAHLAPSMAEKHGIDQKVCLYSQEDAERLASDCGLKVKELWLSGFGNVKLVAEPKERQ